MNEIASLRRTIFKLAFFITIPLVMVLVGVGQMWLGVSFLFGALSSALNLFLMSKDFSGLDLKKGKRAAGFLIWRFFLRFGILGLLLVLAIKYELNLIAFVLGLFMCQILIVLNQTLLKK